MPNADAEFQYLDIKILSLVNVHRWLVDHVEQNPVAVKVMAVAERAVATG